MLTNFPVELLLRGASPVLLLYQFAVLLGFWLLAWGLWGEDCGGTKAQALKSAKVKLRVLLLMFHEKAYRSNDQWISFN